MNPVRTALHAALSGDATLTGLLASPDAIYHQRAPEGAETPYVIFHQQAGPRRLTFGSHLHWDLWLVKAVDRDESASDVEDIDDAVEAVLEGAQLAVTGRAHLYLRRESDVDYPEPDGSKTYRHRGGLYRLITEPT